MLVVADGRDDYVVYVNCSHLLSFQFFKYLKNLQELARKECDIEKCVLAK